MKKNIFTFLALLVMLFSLPLSTHAAGDIRVGVYQNNPKVFVDENGKAEGFFIDLIEHIAVKEGWRIQYVPGTWHQCLDRLENGEIDLLPDIAYSEKRAGRFDLSHKTVLSNWAVVYTQKDSEIESFADLKGKKVAFMQGDITIEQFNSEIRPFGIDFSAVVADDYEGVLKLIHEKKVDAGLVNHLFGIRHEKQYNVIRSPLICCPRELRFAVPKNKNPHLIQTIDRYLVTFEKDRQSVYFHALNRWIEGVSPWRFPKWLSNLLLIAGGLMALFLMITVVSRFQVKAKNVELSNINKELRKEIAERKQTEEVLKSGRAFLSALLDNIEEAVVACDKQGKLIRFNEAARRLHGLPEQPILPEQWSEYYNLFETDGNTPLRKEEIPLFRALQGEYVRGIEMVVARKNRNPRTLISSGQALRDETERIVGAVVAMHDITERKQAEEALRQEFAFSEAVLESLPGVFYLYDENRRFLRWNKNFTRVTGYTDVEMARSHPLDFFTGPDKELLDERIQEVFTKGVSDVEADFVAKDGSRTPYYFTGLKTLINGKVCLLGIGIDITERRQVEAERQKFVMLVDSSSEFIGMCDLDMKPLYVNPAGVRMVGLPDMAAACRVKVQDYFFPEDQRFIAEEFFPRVLREGHGDVEIRMRHFQTGEQIWMFYYLFRVLDAGGKAVGWATVSRDITERVQAEEELKKHRDHLEWLVKARTIELEEKIAEIEQMNRLFVGRELKMVELKEKIKELEARIGD